MKKSFLILVTLVMMSVNVFADGLTATLQQGDKMTPFYGVDAFKNAYAAADSGAVITLSAGTFNIVNSIEKPMKIVGNFGLDASSVERTILSSLAINANKVIIDGVYFSGNVSLGNINDCKITHSWIEGSLTYTSTGNWHSNTVVDQCVIKTESSIKQSKNYTIKNSTVGCFKSQNTKSDVAYINNCIIYDFYSRTGTNTTGKVTPSIPYAVYRNCVFCIEIESYIESTTVTLLNPPVVDTKNKTYYVECIFQSPCEFYNNYFAITPRCSSSDRTDYVAGQGYVSYKYTKLFSANSIIFDDGCLNNSNILTQHSVLNVYPSSELNLGNGDDGKPIGPYGGTGFMIYPNIPRITSSKIDSSTDNEGKLRVTIKVSIPQ